MSDPGNKEHNLIRPQRNGCMMVDAVTKSGDDGREQMRREGGSSREEHDMKESSGSKDGQTLEADEDDEQHDKDQSKTKMPRTPVGPSAIEREKHNAKIRQRKEG